MDTPTERPATVMLSPVTGTATEGVLWSKTDARQETQNTVPKMPRPKKKAIRKRGGARQAEEPPGTSEGEPAGDKASTSSHFLPFSGRGWRLRGRGVNEKAGDVPPSSSSSPTLPSGTQRPPEAKRPKPSNDIKPPASASHEERGIGWEEEYLEPVDREPLVYHMDTGVRCHGYSEDLPEDFFDITTDDIRKRFDQLRSERMAKEEAPLMTQAQRVAVMLKKMERYPKVTLRIQFPDRHVLQGFFRPLETVDALRHFVRSHLADPQQSFYLFTAPPKNNLDDPTATLFQVSLFPTALVYFSSDVEADCYLQKNLLDSRVSALDADRARASCTPGSPTPSSTSLVLEGPFPTPTASNAPANRQSTAAGRPRLHTNSQAPNPVRTDPSKVPKWLKLPGKK